MAVLKKIAGCAARKAGILLASVQLLLPLAPLCAQSIWSREHLEQVRSSLSSPLYADAYKELIRGAEAALESEPLSVMMKEKTPASGDKHDYMSQARYYWPDPSKPDGLPYINRDGVSNPELEKLDRIRLSTMAGRVTSLSLAWYFSGEEKYARKAAELLRVWFFDKKTRMNPNLEYAQMIPGHNGGKGRCYGVIDSYSFIEMLDAVSLLEGSKSFTARDSRKLKKWFGELLDWILTSEQGRQEAAQANNHSVACDVQTVAFALYAGREDVARKVIADFPSRRIFTQIEPDGSQPHELRRTLAFHYSEYNLSHYIDIFMMARKLGVSIEGETSPRGGNFFKAMDFLLPYVGGEPKAWPYKQISGMEGAKQHFYCDLYRTAVYLDPSRTDYLELFRKYARPQGEFNLLFVKQDTIDNTL